MDTLSQILQFAKTQHQANQFEAAEAAYRRILARSGPDHVEALFGLGLILGPDGSQFRGVRFAQ